MLIHTLPSNDLSTTAGTSYHDARERDTIRRVRLDTMRWVLTVMETFIAAAVAWSFVLVMKPSGEGEAGVAASTAVCVWFAAARGLALYDQPILTSAPSRFCLGPVCCLLTAATLLLQFPVDAHLSDHARLLALMCGVQISCCLLVYLCWTTVLRYRLRRGAALERIILLAESPHVARLIGSRLELRSRCQLRVVASDYLSAERQLQVNWAKELCAAGSADRIILVEPRDGNVNVRSWLLDLFDGGLDVTLVPLVGLPVRLCAGAVGLPDLRELPPAMSLIEATGKRLVDVVVSGAGLLVLSPLLLLIAAAIKLDTPGSTMFSQKRRGLNGEVFSMLKFRTMYHHMEDASCQVQTCNGDQRVTFVGRYLRMTSLDELPQLVNVLRGDMALVGPRPHALGMKVAGESLERLVSAYDERHRMKPGMTGLAQVLGSRGELQSARSLRRRLNLDLHYIRNWSPMMDMTIMVKTLATILNDRHAY